MPLLLVLAMLFSSLLAAGLARVPGCTWSSPG